MVTANFGAAPVACAPNQVCDARSGCKPAAACATDADCMDTDPCTVGERCVAATKTCTYSVLDGDGDGVLPASCGGWDCNDDDPLTPSAEHCDMVDNDCDGKIDEGIDTQTDPDNCGGCGQFCESNQCKAGKCTPCGHAAEPCCSRAMPAGSSSSGVSYARGDSVQMGTDTAFCYDAVCSGGQCTACGALGQPCCLDLICNTGVCSNGKCGNKDCGAAPSVATTPGCTVSERACFQACTAGDFNCDYNCLTAASPACNDCINLGFHHCEETVCAKQANALRCCGQDNCNLGTTPLAKASLASCTACQALSHDYTACTVGDGCVTKGSYLLAPECFPPN
jgi:hypothetical protein